MPAESKAQHGFMMAVLHGKAKGKPGKKLPSKKVAAEFKHIKPGAPERVGKEPKSKAEKTGKSQKYDTNIMP
jgi:hypothetical protein